MDHNEGEKAPPQQAAREDGYEKAGALLQGLHRIKAHEKFSGESHTAHICKACAQLPPEEQAERITLNRLYNLPWQFSSAQKNWLQNRMKDKCPELAREQYETRFGAGRRF